MPYTAKGRYYYIKKDGHRKYVPSKDRAGAPKGRSMYSKSHPKRRYVRGRGDYVMDPSHSYGKQWGGYLGSKAGELIGGAAQSALTSLISGLGSYKVRKNIFLDGNLPVMHNHVEGGGTIIRFQEYLGDVVTSSTAGNFNLQSFYINPANSVTFPWLSQIASNYEEYEIEGMIFEFRSTSADALNSTNTALGTVMLATQYDVLDGVFASKLDMLNYEYSQSVKPSENCLHMIECDPRQTSVSTKLYTLNGVAPSGADLRLYHLGLFSLATVGFQAASVNIGELHITYQVRLMKPKLYASLGYTEGYYFVEYASTSAAQYTNALPLGVATPTVQTQVGNLAVVQTGSTLTFPLSYGLREYRVEVIWNGSTGVYWQPPGITAANGSLIKVEDAPPSTDNCTGCAVLIGLSTQAGKQCVVTFDATGTLPPQSGSGISSLEVRIMTVNPTFGAI